MAIRIKGVLNANVLKIIAAVSMVLDHIGAAVWQLRPAFAGSALSAIPYGAYYALRVAGRLALPVFAYLIAEGCKHTSDRKKYFLSVFLLGLVCDFAYFVFGWATGETMIYLCVLTTFSFGILLIYTYDDLVESFRAKDGNAMYAGIKFAAAGTGLVFTYVVVRELGGTMDYGFFGALLPLAAHVVKGKWNLIPFGIVCAAMCAYNQFLNPQTLGQTIYWYMLLALPLLFLYNGERGKYKLKNFFYLFYPAHLVAVYGLIYLLGFLTAA